MTTPGQTTPPADTSPLVPHPGGVPSAHARAPRYTVRVVWIVIAVASVALLAHGLLTPAAPTTTTPPVIAGHTATALPAAPLVGHLAPNITMLDLAGHPVSLASFRGQVVILNFWYIACDPCRYEMPLIEKVFHADRASGVTVIGLNMTDSASDISAYIHLIGVDYTILRDTDQRAVVGYNIIATPTTFVIDRNGVIRAKFKGAITDSSMLEDAVTPLLKAP